MTLKDVKALFARCLGDDTSSLTSIELGSVSLRPHQESAAARIKAALAEFGGALLSDQVGMGKTFVALAVAREHNVTLVVAPAILKDMWRNAAGTASVDIEFVSMESLSHRQSNVVQARPGTISTSLLIVDEAHHFRNSATRRFASLARMAAHANVLLVSATPVHNRQRDLRSLLSLFLGSRADALSQSELARLVIRRSRDEIPTENTPIVEPPRWCDTQHDDEIPDLILGLPPPLPPRDGGDGGVLVIHSLIRQWASSDAALDRSLIRRLQRATALIEALESGSYPTVSELSAWTSAEDCVQLAFASLVASPTSDGETLLPVVRRHVNAIQALHRRLGNSGQRDRDRADVIRELRRAHAGCGIVAFSQYADTIESLFRLLRSDGRVAALTGDGGRVHGGRISRHETIARFAPIASGHRRPCIADEVTLLLTTDLLSEGVNLQDASVVVHLDLPWTPAKMEQRLGRVARMGSIHERVFSYVMRPPASANAIARLERILRQKMEMAGVVIGDLDLLLPRGNRFTPNPPGAPSITEAVRATLSNWKSDAIDDDLSRLASAQVAAPAPGFLALCRRGRKHFVLAGDPLGVTDEPTSLLSAMRACNAAEVPVSIGDLTAAVAAINRHFDGARTLAVDPAAAAKSGTRRHALGRIARIAARARPHARHVIAPLTAVARQSILGRITADGERRLRALTSQTMTDEDWLRELTSIGTVRSQGEPPAEIVAVILLRNETVTKA